MKKIIILMTLVFLCSGCVKINDIDNYDILVDEIINDSDNIVNTTSLGYKYYLPIDVSRLYDRDFNQKFKIDDIYVYMYVDVTSYYNKSSLSFFDEGESNSYYYKKIDNEGKTGYINIIRNKDDYFLKIIYNYAKIEANVFEKDLNKVISYSLIILDSIEYNNVLISNIIENESFSSADKEYEIKKPENTESKFSEYLSEYVQEEESVIPDLPEY